MLRKHRMYIIEIEHRRQIREPDGAGGSDFVGWERELSRSSFTIIAPDIHYAKLWAEDYTKGFHEGRVASVTEGRAITAFIESHDY